MARNAALTFFREKDMMMGTALILVLLSFFLINWGLRDGAWAYWLGILFLAAGMLLPPLSRFTAGSDQDDNDREE